MNKDDDMYGPPCSDCGYRYPKTNSFWKLFTGKNGRQLCEDCMEDECY